MRKGLAQKGHQSGISTTMPSSGSIQQGHCAEGGWETFIDGAGI
jgi:hypothetical protein